MYDSIVGLPAVMRGNYWIVLSNDFTKIARIPIDDIGKKETSVTLIDAGFTKISKEKVREIQIVLILTSKCGLACTYCFADCGIECKSMKEKTARAVIEHSINISKGRRLSLSFFGGEPTIEFGLIKQMVDFVKSKSLFANLPPPYFSITTNGVFGDNILEFLIENNFQITISADGDSEVQDFQRPMRGNGKSSLFVEKTIKSLSERRYQFKVRATVTNFSVNKMVSAVEWLSKLGGREIQFEPVSIAGRAREQSDLISKPDCELFIQNLVRAIEKGSQVGVGVSHSSFMNLIDSPFSFCTGGIENKFAVTCDGNITACVEVQNKCHPASDIFHIGKVDDQTGVITFSDKNNRKCCKIDDDNIKKSGSGEKCSSCFAVRICGGGCPVRNFHTNGDVNTVDEYRCKVTKRLIPYIFYSIDDASNIDKKGET
jgi:uncharacterized protein